MKTETIPVRMDTQYGPLYVAVMYAREDQYHDMERGNITELLPRVRVASDPDFEADPNHADHWTIRRRAYAVHNTLVWKDRSAAEYASGTARDFWHHESSPFGRGYHNDRRTQVEFRTATYDLMWDAELAALETFAAEYPQWQELSTLMRFKGQRDRHAAEAADLMRQAEREKAAADRYREQAAPLFDALPSSLLDLMRS